jgi:ubiquinone/menaquinone biosynthesis C-methylase UbiE
MAEWIGPDGRLELVDLQQQFLDHTMRAAAERGLSNLVPTRGDAADLPYAEASMDAVILTAVLGEIPDPAAALLEIRRVLKPTGRLVVGELFGDPHFTSFASLRRQAAEAGLGEVIRSGNWFGYFARLARVDG